MSAVLSIAPAPDAKTRKAAVVAMARQQKDAIAEELGTMAFEFLGAHESVHGETVRTRRSVCATACTYDDVLVLIQEAFEFGRSFPR